MKSKKIILDTNLWISFLISKRLDEIDILIHERKIKLLFSKELIEEFLTVAKRSKFEKYFSDENINELLRMFDTYGKLIDISIDITECRDERDNFLLSLAVAGNADYLVSGDDDLLVLKKIRKTKIVNWREFTNEIK